MAKMKSFGNSTTDSGNLVTKRYPLGNSGYQNVGVLVTNWYPSYQEVSGLDTKRYPSYQVKKFSYQLRKKNMKIFRVLGNQIVQKFFFEHPCIKIMVSRLPSAVAVTRSKLKLYENFVLLGNWLPNGLPINPFKKILSKTTWR